MDEVASTLPPDRDAAVRRLQGAMDELVVRVRDYYRRASEAIAPGMLPFTFKVLTTVDRLEVVTVSVLAERLGSDKGQISRSVSELESHGLVVRSPDPEDARVKLVQLTPQARDRLSQARLPFEQLLAAALAEWQTDEIGQFAALVTKLAHDVVPR